MRALASSSWKRCVARFSALIHSCAPGRYVSLRRFATTPCRHGVAERVSATVAKQLTSVPPA
jgi:hypothetical protein